MNYNYKLLLVGALALIVGCSKLLGLDEITLGEQSQSAASGLIGCVRHSDCSNGTDYCSHLTHRCVVLKSGDCSLLTGDAYDDNAVLIGSLFATTGDQAVVNLARERSTVLAVSEINAIGGLPPIPGGAGPRRLALLSCDASDDPIRAAEHLVKQLEVSGIVGPNNSQNTLEVARKVTIPGGTVTLSPQAVAGSIAELIDSDLTWQMVPSDAQRGPLMVHELETMARDLGAARARPLKLSIIVRDDALGIGTRASLNGLTWNGEPLASQINFGMFLKIDTYDGGKDSQADLVAAHALFAPDVVVLVGSGDAVNEIMAPLEQRWLSEPRPEYVLIDSSKVPDLLMLVEQRPDLAQRVRGTGTTPSPQSIAINRDFLISYTSRYPDFDEATSAGVGPSYDATYAIAYGIVAARGELTGRGIAQGLRRLSSGDIMPLGPTHILSALRRLEAGESITALGTYSALAWDDHGALSSGSVEIWCIQDIGSRAVFASSGITAEIPSQTLRGANTVCPVRVEARQTTDAGVSTPPPAEPSDAGMPSAARSEDAGMPDAGAPEPPRPVPCGVLQCDRTRSEYCCIAVLREDVAFVEDFSCESQPRDCAVKLRCTSDRECGHGAICCTDGYSESFCRAAASCEEDELHLGCDRPSDCAGGQTCCARGNAQRGQFSTACEDSCEEAQVCHAQEECVGPESCLRSESLPTVATCR
jgi:ABC-type branched-subunit amino acid transport system substrate-binding protein